ncbi:MAG TPA: cyclase family protein [Candidatus Binatia bacterium]|nr:cyclase family protein [Candidatus Binatia bacterium]
MRIVDLSMTVEECDSAPFAPEEKYFKLKPIIRWEEKGFVSNIVEMTVHAGTHIDSPHHFFRDKPSIEQLPLEPMMSRAIVLDLTAKGKAHARITPEDLNEAESKLKHEGIEIREGAMLLLRTDWPKGHDTTDPKWWNDSPCLTKEAADWIVGKKPSVVGYDFAQEEKGSDYQKADEILGSAMRVHRTILPRVTFQIENLINLDQIGSTAQILALPAKWKTESAPARVIAILDN